MTETQHGTGTPRIVSTLGRSEVPPPVSVVVLSPLNGKADTLLPTVQVTSLATHAPKSIFEALAAADAAFREDFQRLHLQMPFGDYLSLLEKHPERNASPNQRMKQAILDCGVEEVPGRPFPHYKFLDDLRNNGRDAVIGVDRAIHEFVNQLGSEDRLFVFYGPNGTGKSTIVRLIKAEVAEYTTTDRGAVFELGLSDPKNSNEILWCPHHENPLHAVPERLRPAYEAHFRATLEKNSGAGNKEDAHAIKIQGHLCPDCRPVFKALLEQAEGSFTKAAESIHVRRIVFSELEQIGSGTFVPRDNGTNGNGTPNTGAGATSSPATGTAPQADSKSPGDSSKTTKVDPDLILQTYQAAARGVLELMELPRLGQDVKSSLLTATQERQVTGGQGQKLYVDALLLGHTTESELMELLKDKTFNERTIGIPVEFNLQSKDEAKIFARDFDKNGFAGRTGPHAMEYAAMMAVLSRLEPPGKANLTLLQKLRLYDGERFDGFPDEEVAKLRAANPREGFKGISPRAIQNVLRAAIAECTRKEIDPQDVFDRFERDFAPGQLQSKGIEKKVIDDILATARAEYREHVIREVTAAWSAQEKKLESSTITYIELVKAYTQREKVRNKYTGQMEEPSEPLMREIEEKMDLPEGRKDTYRRDLIGKIGAKITISAEGFCADGKTFAAILDLDPRLRRAIELDIGATAPDGASSLKAFAAAVLDSTPSGPGTEKFDALVQYLVKAFNYSSEGAEKMFRYAATLLVEKKK